MALNDINIGKFIIYYIVSLNMEILQEATVNCCYFDIKKNLILNLENFFCSNYIDDQALFQNLSLSYV